MTWDMRLRGKQYPGLFLVCVLLHTHFLMVYRRKLITILGGFIILHLMMWHATENETGQRLDLDNLHQWS